MLWGWCPVQQQQSQDHPDAFTPRRPPCNWEPRSCLVREGRQVSPEHSAEPLRGVDSWWQSAGLPQVPLWTSWIRGGRGCADKVPEYGTWEKSFAGKHLLAFFTFLCFALQRSSNVTTASDLDVYIANTLGIYPRSSRLKIGGFPSVLIPKPVLDIPRAGRLSAIAVASDTRGYGTLLLPWDLHKVGHTQHGQLRCGA